MKKILLMTIVFAVFLSSCYNDYYEIEESAHSKKEVKLNNKYKVGIEDAIKIASQALNDLNGTLAESRSNSKFNNVKQVM